jgi:hypothetical protein
MTLHLLRIEAVNLESVLADTPHLSVIRGGGLMALEAVRLFAREPLPGAPPSAPARGWLARLLAKLRRRRRAPGPQPVLISGGASVGLYTLKLPPDPGPEPHAAQVAAILHRLAQAYPQHSFVVDIEPMPNPEQDFESARKRVTARNRLGQMMQPSMSLADCAPAAAGPCDFDDLRPAVRDKTLEVGAEAKRRVRLSASVASRYDYGVAAKRDFLNRTTGLDLHYTRDFEQLAGRCPAARRLQNKLAVLYFDGNGFGRLQAACRKPDELKALDQYLRSAREKLLAGLLQHLDAQPDGKVRLAKRGSEVAPEPAADGIDALRFELLLWGGDELLFVVPAWLGLSALHKFYELSAHWQWQGEPLTHAGALLLCADNTPIDRMTALARELAERVKEQDRAHNRCDYLVLESIDFPAEPLRRYFARRYPALAACRAPLAWPKHADDALRTLARLRADGALPHGPLHEGALALTRRDDACDQADAAAAALTADLERRAAVAGDHAQAAVAQLCKALVDLFPGQTAAWRWVHLAELWDYLVAAAPAASEHREGDA